MTASHQENGKIKTQRHEQSDSKKINLKSNASKYTSVLEKSPKPEKKPPVPKFDSSVSRQKIS
jgi:hypothetical protein